MMKTFKRIIAVILLFAMLACISSCGAQSEKIKIKLLFIPKFESGEMYGDDVGEAQLFYEEYCTDSVQYTLKNNFALYYNENNGVAMGLTQAGKVNTAMFATALFCDERFDLSDAYIMGIGCAGSAYGSTTMGDVVIISEAVDYDLGYQTIGKDENGDAVIQWYDNPDTHNNAHKKMNTELVEWAYEKTKDIELETTENTLRALERNFPGEKWAERQPEVLTGTAVTADVYWKGECEHNKAQMLAEFFECTDPYRITEMEDASCAVVMDSFGMLDRLIILRASVGLDVYMDGATAESTWGNTEKYEDKVIDENEENSDIFVPAMRNLFKVGKIIADSVLDGAVMK